MNILRVTFGVCRLTRHVLGQISRRWLHVDMQRNCDLEVMGALCLSQVLSPCDLALQSLIVIPVAVVGVGVNAVMFVNVCFERP